MKNLTIALILFASSTALYAKDCIEFAAPSGENFEKISMNAPKKTEEHIQLLLTAGKNSYDGHYYCYKEKKTDKSMNCSGDDDGGRFMLTLEEDSASIEIQYLNVGDPDRQNFQLLRKKKIKMVGKYTACK